MNNDIIRDKDFEKTVTLYDKKIESVISRFEKNSENVKDIKQDIYCKLFSKKLYTEECINTWQWLKTVVSNHCKNHIRDNSKLKFLNEYNETEHFSMLENIPDKKMSGNLKVDSENLQDYIYERVCSLKPKYRDVIILYDYEEMSYENIAKKLNCPVGTVKSRLFKSRMLLKEELKELLD